MRAVGAVPDTRTYTEHTPLRDRDQERRTCTHSCTGNADESTPIGIPAGSTRAVPLLEACHRRKHDAHETGEQTHAHGQKHKCMRARIGARTPSLSSRLEDARKKWRDPHALTAPPDRNSQGASLLRLWLGSLSATLCVEDNSPSSLVERAMQVGQRHERVSGWP